MASTQRVLHPRKCLVLGTPAHQVTLRDSRRVLNVTEPSVKTWGSTEGGTLGEEGRQIAQALDRREVVLWWQGQILL